MNKLFLIFSGHYNPETTALYSIIAWAILLVAFIVLGPIVVFPSIGAKIVFSYGLCASVWNHWDESSWLKIIVCWLIVAIFVGQIFLLGF